MGVVFEHNHECWPDVINGPRIMLKKINPTLENAQMFFDAVQNNIHHLKDSFDFLVHKITTVDETLAYLTESQKEADLGRRDNYGIFYNDTFIGIIFVWGGRHTEREILYWLTEDACRHGFMNEALELVEGEHAKSAPRRELFAIVNDKARASASLLMKRGYSCDGASFWKMPNVKHKPLVVAKQPIKIEQTEGRIYG